MIVRANEQAPTLMSGDMMTADMGISTNLEDQLMILNVLSNTLYSDKPAAVLREYGCNAADANTEAGKGDVPIEVRLPNKLEPTLSIRDFGFGMTQEQILTVFCRLGRSTKRASNEFTGMLGIGSKAGFAYGDQFNVTSWTSGKRVIYSCFRDKGAPRIAKLDEKDNTGQPDGIEVKIPIKQADIDQFAVTAERVYRYFKVQPKITGQTIVFRRSKPSQQGTGWRYVGDGKSIAIMGNVGYDINYASLGDKLTHKMITLLQLGIELDFNIGELEIAATREGLQYRDITNNAIVARMKHVLGEVGTLFSNQIAGATTMYEAKKLYYELFQQRGNYGQQSLRDAVSDKVTWNGKPITTGKYSLERDEYQAMNQGPNKGLISITCISRPSGYGRRRRRNDRWFEWYASDKYKIILNDLPKKSHSPTREAGFWADTANASIERVLILAFEDDKEKAKWWTKWELDGYPTVLMSTITPLKTVSTSNPNGPSVHRNKHQASAFVLKDKDGSDYTQSMNWDTVTVDPDKDSGVYVSLHNFNVQQKPPGWGAQSNHFRLMVTMLRKAGLLKSYPKIYGFKETWLNRPIKGKVTRRLGAGWLEFDDVLTKEITAWMVGKEQAYANFLESQSHKDFITAADWSAVPKGNSLAEYRDSLTTLKQCSHADLFDCLRRGSYANYIGKAPTNLPKPVVHLDALVKKVRADFPMLSLWAGDPRYYGGNDLKSVTKEQIKLAVEYVNMVLSV